MSIGIFLTGVAIVVIWLVQVIAGAIHSAFLSPLAKVPGLWLARLTPLPYLFTSIVQQRQAQYVHSLHQVYGPVVRIAPNHVSIASYEGHSAIHRVGSGFTKDPSFYHSLGLSGTSKPPHGIFQLTNVHAHAARRRLFSRGFSVANLRKEWEEVLMAKVQTVIAGIKVEAKQDASTNGGLWGCVDLRKWWMLFASDVVSHMVFGKSFDGLQTGMEAGYFESIRHVNEAAALHNLSPWLFWIARHVPLPRFRSFFRHIDVVSARGETAVLNSLKSAGSRNIFAEVLAQAEREGLGEEGLTDADIVYEAEAIMVAGSDTTSQTLTYAIWRVLLDPELRAELEEEAASVELPARDAQLETLPVLQAVIWETLRLYRAAPGPWPRVVPKGGHVFHGYYIPEGTIVSAQAWTIHRDPGIFEDPERFDHKRWLPDGSAATSTRARASWVPFGAGTRSCIGRYLAEMELRHAVFSFVRDCKEARLAPETTPGSMEVMGYILIRPKSRMCRSTLPIG